jgi:hypothetical protein
MMTELPEAWMGGALCDLPQLGQSRAEESLDPPAGDWRSGRSRPPPGQVPTRRYVAGTLGCTMSKNGPAIRGGPPGLGRKHRETRRFPRCGDSPLARNWKDQGLMPLANAYDRGQGQGDVFGGYSEARTRLARRKAKAETEYFEAVDASWASTLTGLGVSQIATRL